MDIKPSNIVSGPHLDNYYLRRYDNDHSPLSTRDFWVLASPIFDYVSQNLNTTFIIDPSDWTVDEFFKINTMLKECPNYSVK